MPNCCAECPFCGIIPKNERPKGTKETHVCLATFHALSGRGIVSISKRHARPCDHRWKTWRRANFEFLAVPIETYYKYRLPFEDTRRLTRIIFHYK